MRCYLYLYSRVVSLLTFSKELFHIVVYNPKSNLVKDIKEAAISLAL
jgi:hypothetical protein